MPESMSLPPWLPGQGTQPLRQTRWPRLHPSGGHTRHDRPAVLWTRPAVLVGVLVVGLVLVLSACTAKTEVPPQVRDRVQALIPGAAVQTTAETCRRVELPPSSSYTANADVPGNPETVLREIRDAGIRSGWQPYHQPGRQQGVVLLSEPASNALDTTSPAQVPLIAWVSPMPTGVDLQVVSDTGCSDALQQNSGRTPAAAVDLVPDWTPAQQATLETSLATAHQAAAGIADIVGLAQPTFPASSPARPSTGGNTLVLVPCPTAQGGTGLAWFANSITWPTASWTTRGSQQDIPALTERMRQAPQESGGGQWQILLEATANPNQATLQPVQPLPGRPQLKLSFTAAGGWITVDAQLATDCIPPR